MGFRLKITNDKEQNMVNGIELFREHFSDYKEQYTIIGGFACDLLMTDAGLDFRQTVDIDMVIIIEALTTEFASAFWISGAPT